MQFTDISQNLSTLLTRSLKPDTFEWLQQRIASVVDHAATKDLYLGYSLLASKVVSDKEAEIDFPGNPLGTYLKAQGATPLQLARMYLLIGVLEGNTPFFAPKIAQIIQVADTGELITFLKFLILLPEPETYRSAAVEALRTNIVPVFDAISAHNPYPSQYFNDQEWNQMYLKAAFMERDLSAIMDVKERANGELARIISDYAHERWAASRKVDPLFWKPVGNFLDDRLLEDMKRLLNSPDAKEQLAGALCCVESSEKAAVTLLQQYPKIQQQVANDAVSWDTLNVYE